MPIGCANVRKPFCRFTTRTACLVFCFVLTSGCGDSLSARNFAKVVEHRGQPAIKIECEYVGKSPGAPDAFMSKHDYRKIDTDFYRVSFENLTDDDIVIDRILYRLEKGPVKGQQSTAADSIRQTWGTNVIQAKSKISRANNMVWAKAKRNTLIKTYFFRIANGDDEPKTLKAEVPLVYIR
jgi:hypothetical protein